MEKCIGLEGRGRMRELAPSKKLIIYFDSKIPFKAEKDKGQGSDRSVPAEHLVTPT